uniref:Replicase region Tombus_P33 n=1 Tax=Erysiphe necator associated tombus-like virus 10 TaxID=2744814 RepID=A0A8E3YZ11_9TOMB|nr:replicase region Tombus_P33 [Erysiphe necator associated tombus-like virus 10]
MPIYSTRTPAPPVLSDLANYDDNQEWRLKAHIVPVTRNVKVRVGPWMAFKMLFKGYIHPEDQLKAKHIVEEYQNPTCADPTDNLEDASAETRKPRHSNHWWAAYSLLAHAQFHSPRFTRANEMIVSSWIRKAMEADKVRRIDIARVLPLAVRTAFVPTDMDAFAVKMDNAPAVRRQHKKRDIKYWSSWFSLRSGHYESAC